MPREEKSLFSSPLGTAPPEDEDTFVHRAGRTGRAGRSGVNVVLYSGGAEGSLMRLEKSVGINFDLE
ncbi:hypothetical protein T484DRAFT_1864718, partial [Baffinella frigidus]